MSIAAENKAAATPEADNGKTLVLLPALSADGQQQAMDAVRVAFGEGGATVALPGDGNGSDSTVLHYAPQNTAQTFVPAAADYFSAWQMLRDTDASAVVVLGAEAGSVSAASLTTLAQTVHAGADIALPRYPLTAQEGLINFSILSPLSRALFHPQAIFPLPLDIAVSRRMAERMATVAQRATAAGQPGALVWPAAEAAVAGFTLRTVNVDARSIPQPTEENITNLLSMIAASLFADVESKAAYWQRARLHQQATVAQRPPAAAAPLSPELSAEVAPMLDQFRYAYNNLRELWSLVLPPQSLLALKKLSVTPLESFALPYPLWARIVYDFLLAYRLRTLNRGHLLGALTPLYLAWVASFVRAAGNDADRAQIERDAVATAFENDKPYLVARWRWPDRFNP
jgi:hypothetical protein